MISGEEALGMGISYSHFRRLFRAYVGDSPHNYLLSQRMQLATKLLRDPSMQIKDIAHRLGYEDPAQFCRLFKTRVGLSATRLRDSLRKVEMSAPTSS
jgi:AraC-like DNA-binding protein